MTDISGILNINKPSGVTSFWAVKQAKRILGIKKVGHCGTLDPLAEGVLVILLGKTTKLQSSLMAGDKTYKARLKLGVTTDTGDITGKVLKEAPVGPLDTANVTAVLDSFVGAMEQIPPMYSALNYGGKRLYDFARAGIEVKREPRGITIHSIDLLDAAPGRIDIRVKCSKGTYIRTLGEDIGKKLGCGATLEALCRERSGDYGVETALDGRLLQSIGREELVKHIINIETINKEVA